MANFRALTIQSGTTTQIQDGNTLIVGAGITTAAGNLSVSAAGGTVSFLNNLSLAAAVGIAALAGAGAFDFSAASGLFKTSTGAVTIGPGATTMSGATTFTAAGTALTVNNNATISGTLTTPFVDTTGILDLGANNSETRIGKSGTDVVVRGNLVISGTTTTVNSTVLDIADRVIHVNNSTGANDPVPTNVCGLSVHRGAVATVARDHSAIVWDESTSRWNFCLNTGGDDITIGADQAVKMGALTVTAALAQSGGAFSLNGGTAASTIQTTGAGTLGITTGAAALTITAGAASTWSTSSGPLTLTSAAAATWSTTAGALTLNGAGGMNLQGGGTTALAINSAGTAITVQAGATLATTGTGNINLPNNGSSRFKIEGTSVGATVTAPNLDTLTNGSNADALHTHASMSGNLVCAVTTTGLASGDVGYISGADTVSKTDSAAIATARVLGINEGTAGSMTVAGCVTAKFTTAGGSPTNGAPVYLAAAADDGATGAGKLTATAPSSGVIAEFGLCMNNANYAGLKTCRVHIQVKAPVVL